MKIEMTKCLQCGGVGVHIRGRSWTCKSCGSRQGVYLTARGMWREAINGRRRDAQERLSGRKEAQS